MFVPRVIKRTIARWSPSKGPFGRAAYVCSSRSDSVHAQARLGPLQATAIPATHAASIVTTLPLETPHRARSNPPNGIDRRISVLPKAAPQAEKNAAPLAQVCSECFVHSCIPSCSVTHALLLLRIMAQSVMSTSYLMALSWSSSR